MTNANSRVASTVVHIVSRVREKAQKNFPLRKGVRGDRRISREVRETMRSAYAIPALSAFFPAKIFFPDAPPDGPKAGFSFLYIALQQCCRSSLDGRWEQMVRQFGFDERVRDYCLCIDRKIITQFKWHSYINWSI